jgi:hypothetical protein
MKDEHRMREVKEWGKGETDSLRKKGEELGRQTREERGREKDVGVRLREEIGE